jgi:hypothetical protein
MVYLCFIVIVIVIVSDNKGSYRRGAINAYLINVIGLISDR